MIFYQSRNLLLWFWSLKNTPTIANLEKISQQFSLSVHNYLIALYRNLGFLSTLFFL